MLDVMINNVGVYKINWLLMLDGMDVCFVVNMIVFYLLM